MILTVALLESETWFRSPGSILLDLGPIKIRYYGLMIACAFIVTLLLANKLINTAPKNQLATNKTKQEFDNFAIVALASGILGARTWFVLLNAEYFSQHLIEIPQIWLGGQSIQGGLIGAFIGTYIYDRYINKSSPQDYLHKLAILTCILPLAQSIGRWGNFFNEEAFGKACNLPWGLYISHTGLLHHPAFLYESIGDLIIFLILWRLFYKLQDQQIIGLYLILYSSLRLVLENIRTDSLMLFGFPAASLLCLAAILIGVLLLRARQKTRF